jgi:hypothetical protein
LSARPRSTLLTRFAALAQQHGDVRVRSWDRGPRAPDRSDVDLVLLTRAAVYLDRDEWLEEVGAVGPVTTAAGALTGVVHR